MSYELRVQRVLNATAEEVRDFFATTAWNGAFDRIERYLALRASR